MKKIALAFAALITLCGTAHAQSTPPLATVVSACGTPPSTYTAGQNRPILQDTNGLQCSAATTTPSGTQNVQGVTASGAAVTENPLASGCRAATAAPTAVTDGQKVNNLCGETGKQVTMPYALKENQVRGKGTGTDNAAHSIIASAGGSLKNYIVSVECNNTSSTTTTVTFSDDASSVMNVPGQGANNWIGLGIPLATAAATAFTFTAAVGVSTMTCNAQGYTGL